MEHELAMKPKWPPDDELDMNKKTILLGYLTSGNVTNRETGYLFLEPQASYFNDGALSVAIKEINKNSSILPSYNVSNILVMQCSWDWKHLKTIHI